VSHSLTALRSVVERFSRVVGFPSADRVPPLGLMMLVASVGASAPLAAAQSALVLPEGWSSADAPAPKTINATLRSDFPAYDLCWAPHRNEAKLRLASSFMAGFEGPERLYVLHVADLLPRWEPLDTGALVDMNGATIDRNVLRNNRTNYERDVSQAIADVMRIIRRSRPEARMTMTLFQPIGRPEYVIVRYPEAIAEFSALVPAPAGPMRADSANRRNDALAESFGESIADWAEDNGVPLVMFNDGPATYPLDRQPINLWESFTLVAPDGSTMFSAPDSWNGDGVTFDGQAPSIPTDQQLTPPEPPAGSDPSDGGDGSPKGLDDDTADVPTDLRSKDDLPSRYDDDGASAGWRPYVPSNPGNSGGALGNMTGHFGHDGAMAGTTPDPGGDGDDPTDPPADDPPADDDPAPSDPDDDNGDSSGDDGGAAVGRVLQPGGGFTSSDSPLTTRVGVPGDAGYDAKAIARWNAVPYQDITGPFNVGVVAFHINGIDRVEFMLDGGDPIVVEEMSHNPRTDTWEYWATIDPSVIGEDGMVEVRAVAWPEGAGEARVLEGLDLYAAPSGQPRRADVYVSATRGDDATADGTPEKPFRTLWAAMKRYGGGADISGLTLRLEAGEYGFGGDSHPRPVTTDGWVTIAPAPGVAKEDVVISGGGRFRVKHLAVRDVMLDLSDGGSIGNFPTYSPSIWFDNVTAIGPGAGVGTTVSRWQGWSGLYYTDCEFSDFRDGTQGATIARNVTLRNLGSDAFGDSRLVVNGEVYGISVPPGRDYHPDVFQFSGTGTTRDNTIVYGLYARDIGAQGLFADDLTNIDNTAFVNVLIEQKAGGGYKSQWDVEADHLLLWHVSILNQSFAWRGGSRDDLSVRGCIFQKSEGVVSGPDWALRSNHFIDATSYGANTFGDDVSTGSISGGGGGGNIGQYVPLERIDDPVIPIDVQNTERTLPTAVGAYGQAP